MSVWTCYISPKFYCTRSVLSDAVMITCHGLCFRVRMSTNPQRLQQLSDTDLHFIIICVRFIPLRLHNNQLSPIQLNIMNHLDSLCVFLGPVQLEEVRVFYCSVFHATHPSRSLPWTQMSLHLWGFGNCLWACVTAVWPSHNKHCFMFVYQNINISARNHTVSAQSNIKPVGKSLRSMLYNIKTV